MLHKAQKQKILLTNANVLINQRSFSTLNDESKPVQLIFAGKAHPADKEGQDLIRYIHDSLFKTYLLVLKFTYLRTIF